MWGGFFLAAAAGCRSWAPERYPDSLTEKTMT